MSLIKGLHHISMKTCNDEEYRRARSFYVDLLGLRIVKECEACLLLDTGSGIVEIFRNGVEPLPQGVLRKHDVCAVAPKAAHGRAATVGNLRHFAFAVDDVAACANLVEQAGYEVFVQPKSVNIGGDEKFPCGGGLAFCRRHNACKGPLGEEIEFFCQKWGVKE